MDLNVFQLEDFYKESKIYKVKETIHGKLFLPGDEEGMSCIPLVYECKFLDENGHYKQCTKCKLHIVKRPYISGWWYDEDEDKTRYEKYYGEWGEYYICESTNNRWLERKEDFEKMYEAV